MFEYICEECEWIEYSIELEPKKTCPECGFYMETKETTNE